jgi:hypothetical protein
MAGRVNFGGTNGTYGLGAAAAGVPIDWSLTITGVARVNAAPGGQQLLVTLGNNGPTDGVFLYYDQGAGSMSLYTAVGGTPYDNADFGSRPSAGTTFEFFVSCAGRNVAGGAVAGWRAAGSSSWTTVSADTPTSAADIRFYDFGGIAGVGFYLDLSLENVKVWDRQLSLAEIDVEARYRAVKFPTSLLGHFHLITSTDVVDRGGAGNSIAYGTVQDDVVGHALWKPGAALMAFIAAAGTQFDQAVSGSITAAGSLVKQAQRKLTGAITGTGALLKSTARALAGSITGAGAVVKQTARKLVGSITGSGALAASVVFVKSIGGSITAAGSLVGDLIEGAQTFFKTVTGSITAAGALTRQVAFSTLVQGTITAAGVVRKLTARTLAGSTTAAGVLRRQTQRLLTGTITLAGVIQRLTARKLVGSITAAGVALRAATLLKATSGVITAAGAVARLLIPFSPWVGNVINRAHMHLRRLISRR